MTVFTEICLGFNVEEGWQALEVTEEGRVKGRFERFQCHEEEEM